jgi:hypothetical protein
MGANRWQLEEGYRIAALADSGAPAEAVIDFWTREAELDPLEARRRIAEVLLVATAADGEVAGVSTAFIAPSSRLRLDFWHQRGFVGAAHRKSSIGMQFAILGLEHLELAFVSGRDTRCAGLILEIENEGIKHYFNRGTELAVDMTFIGENERGDHVRVHYFPGALAPRPPG